MAIAFPPPCTTASTVDGAIAVMEQIDRSLPARDGLACFNRMYLGVTRQVSARIEQGFFHNCGVHELHSKWCSPTSTSMP